MALNYRASLLLLMFAGQGMPFTSSPSFACQKVISGSHSASPSDDFEFDSPNRRQFISNSLLLLSSPALLTAGATPAVADVSDGTSLPKGAAQFGRVVRAKSNMAVCNLSCMNIISPDV
jgi:hypothetical protein